MRCLSCLKFRYSSASIICMLFKSIAFIATCYGILYFSGMVPFYSNTVVKTRSLSELSNWQCELNKRMLEGLHQEIESRDKLLKYRGKVIANLRNQLLEINSTNKVLTRTLANLTQVIMAQKNRINKSSPTAGNFFRNYAGPTPFPSNLRSSVDRPSRPCCMALKRMTDILRVYMETTQELREQVTVFQHLNISEQIQALAEQERLKFNVRNCSQYYNDQLYNLTKKPERYSTYQTFSDGFFYEAIYEMRMKQKFTSKSFHRNKDFSRAVSVALQELLKTSKLPAQHFHIDDALVKYDELYGAEYKISFLYNNTRKFDVDVVKSYGPLVTRDRPVERTVSHQEVINIIVPVTGRTDRFVAFLNNVKVAVESGERIYLTVVIYGTDPDNEIKKMIKNFSESNQFNSYDILKRALPFNRGRALHDGILRWNGYENVLMFLCDVDMKFDVSFLQRCRKHTIARKSVYIPVVFSLYNPKVVFNGNKTKKKYFEIGESRGIWRTLGYGMVCTYRPDYMHVKGYNLRINGWGGEDISLYNRYIKKGYKVIRAPDPGLFHVWHPKDCPKSLTTKQHEGCLGSKARFEGSQRQLGIILLNRTSF